MTVCSWKDCVFLFRRTKVGVAIKDVREDGKTSLPQARWRTEGRPAQKASAAEEPVGCCCLLENKDSGKHSRAGSGEGQLGARPTTLVVGSGVFPPKGKRNSDRQESLEKEDLGVEGGLGEQAWDLGQSGQWGSLGEAACGHSLSLFLSLPLSPPPSTCWRRGQTFTTGEMA